MNPKIKILKGDITALNVDVIVNAAKASLLGGGGVDGAIHHAGGPTILDECIRIGGCDTGEAVITTAGNLHAKCVIHTVGPIWEGGENQEILSLNDCYVNTLQLAVDNGMKTIAFPNISTGVYGFPKYKAAVIAILAVNHFLKNHPEIDEVTFVCFDDDNYLLYTNLLITLTI